MEKKVSEITSSFKERTLNGWMLGEEAKATFRWLGAPFLQAATAEGDDLVTLHQVHPLTVTEQCSTVRAILARMRGVGLRWVDSRRTEEAAVGSFLETFPNKLWVAPKKELLRTPPVARELEVALFRLVGLSETVDFRTDLNSQFGDKYVLYLNEGGHALMPMVPEDASGIAREEQFV